MNEWLEMWAEFWEGLWAPVAHVFTRTLPAAILVGLAGWSWQLAVLALGLGIVVQHLHVHDRELKPHGGYARDRWFGLLGVAIFATGAFALGKLAILLPLVLVGLLLWELGWHRWQHRRELNQLSRYGDDRYPRRAREWAWAGLTLAVGIAAITFGAR